MPFRILVFQIKKTPQKRKNHKTTHTQLTTAVPAMLWDHIIHLLDQKGLKIWSSKEEKTSS